MRLLREYIQSLLSEGYDDCINIIVRIRVKIEGPDSRTLRDILTDVRGLINVITVEQIGKISERDFDGRAFVHINIKFEDDQSYHVPQMLKDIKALPDVDLVKFIKIEKS